MWQRKTAKKGDYRYYGPMQDNQQTGMQIFQLLGEGDCWWTSESPRAHVVKFYGRFRLISSGFRASKFSVLKLIEIVICGFITPSLLA